MAELAAGTITGPLLDGVDGLTQAMIGLANSGILTEDMFKGLAEQVGTTYGQAAQARCRRRGGPARHCASLQRAVWSSSRSMAGSVDAATQGAD